MIKEKKMDLKNMFVGLGVIFLYLILSSIPYDFIKLFGINYNNLNLIIKEIYLILYEVSLLFLIIYIYRKDFIPNFKDFIKNMLKYIKKYIKYWFIILILMVISTLIINIFTKSYVSQNQQTIIEEFKIAPIYILISIILIIPMLEELVFRLSLKKIFAHTKFLFIFSSGFLFGFLHVIGYLENLTDLLFIIPYSIPGFIFAYIYDKSKNICVPISLHIIHNCVMTCIQLILILVK